MEKHRKPESIALENDSRLASVSASRRRARRQRRSQRQSSECSRRILSFDGGVPKCAHSGGCCLHGHSHVPLEADSAQSHSTLTREQWDNYARAMRRQLTETSLERSAIEKHNLQRRLWREKHPRGRRVRPKRRVVPTLVSSEVSFPFDALLEDSVHKSATSASLTNSSPLSEGNSIPGALVCATDSSDYSRESAAASAPECGFCIGKDSTRSGMPVASVSARKCREYSQTPTSCWAQGSGRKRRRLSVASVCLSPLNAHKLLQHNGSFVAVDIAPAKVEVDASNQWAIASRTVSLSPRKSPQSAKRTEHSSKSPPKCRKITDYFRKL